MSRYVVSRASYIEPPCKDCFHCEDGEWRIEVENIDEFIEIYANGTSVIVSKNSANGEIELTIYDYYVE